MRTIYAAVALFAVIVVGAQAAADREWQTGTWTQIGINRTVFVPGAVNERRPPGQNTPQKTEVARYVIETEDRRYELQSIVAIGTDAFDLSVRVGNPVTFAVEKKTAYIKLDENKGEYRLLVVKNEQKKTR